MFIQCLDLKGVITVNMTTKSKLVLKDPKLITMSKNVPSGKEERYIKEFITITENLDRTTSDNILIIYNGMPEEISSFNEYIKRNISSKYTLIHMSTKIFDDRLFVLVKLNEIFQACDGNTFQYKELKHVVRPITSDKQ